MRPMSNKKRRQLAERARVRYAVFERDGGCLAEGVKGLGKCWGPWTPHHVLKASQGGAYSPDNLITLCSHHNSLFEADADAAEIARENGFVRKSWEAADG